jgi:hypothetical protein
MPPYEGLCCEDPESCFDTSCPFSEGRVYKCGCNSENCEKESTISHNFAVNTPCGKYSAPHTTFSDTYDKVASQKAVLTNVIEALEKEMGYLQDAASIVGDENPYIQVAVDSTTAHDLSQRLDAIRQQLVIVFGSM